MPNLVTTGVTADPYASDIRRHLFIASDNYRIGIWGNNYASKSPGAGWAAAASIGSAPDLSTVPHTVSQIGDTLHLWYISGTTLTHTQMPWNATSHAMGTITSGTFDMTRFTAGSGWQSVDAVYDSGTSFWYLVASHNNGAWIISLSAAGTPVFGASYRLNNTLSLSVSIANNGGSLAAAYAVNMTGLPVYLMPFTSGGGGTITAGTQEQPITGAAVPVALFLDGSNLINLVWQTGGTVNAIKRTGTNTYSATVTVATGATSGCRPVVGLNAGTDAIWCYYTSTANQANGEIYVAKRTGGSWGTGTLCIGGDAAGYTHATAAAAPDGSGNYDILYVTGTSSYSLYHLSGAASAAPNTPTGITPSGYVSGITPHIGWTYSNPVASDTQGSYEIRVTRVSDSFVMWDSGKVAGSSTSVTYGTGSNTGDVNYVAPTALSLNIAYQAQVKAWDSIANSPSSYSAATSFTPIQGPAPALLSLTAHGTVNTGTASSTLSANTLANATSLTVQTGAGVSFTHDGTTKVSVGASPAINTVTVSALATDTLTVAAMVDAHSSGDAVVQDVNTVAAVGGSALTLSFVHQQNGGNSASAYTVKLYENDGVTLVASTSGSISLAAKSSYSVGPWTPAGIVNGHTYKLTVSTTDAVTGVVGESQPWTITTSYIPPSPPSGFTATNVDNSGWVALAWTNSGSPLSNAVYWRVNGTSAWTALPLPAGKAGTTFTALKVWAPVSVAYDYAVTETDSVAESAKAVATGVTLGLKYGAYGHWFSDVTDPVNYSVALGAFQDWQQGTNLEHVEDVLRYTPAGRAKPIVGYGLDDHWRSQGRQYFVPATDGDGSGSTTNTQVLTALTSINRRHNLVLYRDPTGEMRFVVVEGLKKFVEAPIHTNVQFSFEEQDTTLTVLTV